MLLKKKFGNLLQIKNKIIFLTTTGASCEDLRRSNYLFEKMGVEFSKYEPTSVTKYPTIYSLQAEQDLKALENAFAVCFDALR